MLAKNTNEEQRGGHMTPEEIAERFSIFDDWEERYAYIIDLGRKLPPFEEQAKTEENLVRGCISQVWLTSRFDGDKIHFSADSDAVIVKGLIAIVLMIHSDKTPTEILALKVDDLFEQLGLGGHVTINRRNGFYSMLETIKRQARAHAA